MAKLWVGAGHEVRLASRHPDDLQPLVKTLGTRASAVPDPASPVTR
jgi:hypothetical protein